MRRPALFSVLLFGFVASEWQATADDNPAANAPDRFAWQLFVALNQSARNGTQDATWETWALQDDVYADLNNQPQFPTPAHRPLRLRPSRQLQIFNDRLKALNRLADLISSSTSAAVGGRGSHESKFVRFQLPIAFGTFRARSRRSTSNRC